MRKTLLSSIKLSELTILERNSEFIAIAEAVAEAEFLEDSRSSSHPPEVIYLHVTANLLI